MTSYRSIMTYDGLPIKSGGAHRLKIKDPFQAWESIQSFLVNCTNYTIPETISLQVMQTQKSDYLIREIEELFGKPGYIRTIGDYKASCWELDTSHINTAIKFANMKYDLLPHSLSIVHLGIFTRFKLINIQTREILHHQDRQEYLNSEPCFNRYLGESSLYTTLSYRQNSLNAFFSFPFDEVNQFILDYLNQIQLFLPFKFSENHWKIWHMNKARTSYIGRKIKVI